jgi:hypothetical protein
MARAASVTRSATRTPITFRPVRPPMRRSSWSLALELPRQSIGRGERAIFDLDQNLTTV